MYMTNLGKGGGFMSTDNAGKPAKSDVPPHNRIIKFNTQKEILCHGRFTGENAGTY